MSTTASKWRVGFASDLHWEGRAIMPAQVDKHIGQGDLFVLAGDIINARYWRRHPNCHIDYFLEQLLEKYGRVAAIAGNHEPYHGDYDESLGFLREEYDKRGVDFLHNTHVIYYRGTESLTVYGGTMWTNMNQRDPMAELAALQSMNDFRFISVADRKFLPADTVAEHEAFIHCMTEWGVRSDIVVSHHAPTPLSIPQEYANDYPLNYAYFTDLHDFIAAQKPKLWIHGHMHKPVDLMVHSTRIGANPWGHRHENNPLNLERYYDVPA